jgi:uncharacterized protein (DUF2141 family)
VPGNFRTNISLTVLAGKSALALSARCQQPRPYLALVGDDMKHSALQIAPVGEPVEHPVADMDLYCQKEDLTVNGQPMNESYCATIVGGYALSFIYSAKGKEKLEEVEGSLDPDYVQQKTVRRTVGTA